MTTKGKVLGSAGWTPRERVQLFWLMADNAYCFPDVQALLAELRQVIAGQECQPEPATSEWDWRPGSASEGTSLTR